MIFLVLGNQKFPEKGKPSVFRIDCARAADWTMLETMEQALPPGPALFFGQVLKLQPFRAEYFLANLRIAHAHIRPLDANPVQKAYQK